MDGRSAEEALRIEGAHEGAKSVKLTFMGNTIDSPPPGKHDIQPQAARTSLQVLDSLVSHSVSLRSGTLETSPSLSTQSPLIRQQASSCLSTMTTPMSSTSLVRARQDPNNYISTSMTGKGDGNIRYWECVDEKPYAFPLSEYRSTVACKGMCFLPKRGLDVMKVNADIPPSCVDCLTSSTDQCETARALKLTGNTVEPLRFIVPRKSDAFQEDLYPPTFAGVASQTAGTDHSMCASPTIHCIHACR